MGRATPARSPHPAKPAAGSGRAARLKPPPFQPVQPATLVDRVPTGERWVHKMKYDGCRTLVAIGGGAAKAYSRSGLDWSERFAPLLSEAKRRSTSAPP
jgi:bifunctional non-homologous end joining protein LigD